MTQLPFVRSVVGLAIFSVASLGPTSGGAAAPGLPTAHDGAAGGGAAIPAPGGSTPLTLLDAVGSAAAHFPSVAAARARREAAAASVGEATAARYPTLRLQGTATQYQEPMLVTPLHGFRPDVLPPFSETVLQGALNASWTLFDGGARGARIDAARGQEDLSAATLTAAEQDLLLRVVNAYFLVLTSSQVLDAQDQRIQALAAEHERATKLLAAGRAANVEVLRAEAARASAEAERVRLAALLDVAERDLARVTGLALDRTRAGGLVALALADTTPPDRAAALAAARDTSPLVVQSRGQLDASAAQARVARGSRWPRIDLFGNYIGWSDAAGHDALEWNAGAQLAYPFFTGGAVSKGIERADALHDASGEALRTAELQVEEEIDWALARIAQAHARVRSLTTAVARYSEVARIERLSLDAGSGTQTDYLRAEADLLESRAGLAEARHGEMAAFAQLARVAGRLDPDWIARTLEDRP